MGSIGNSAALSQGQDPQSVASQASASLQTNLNSSVPTLPTSRGIVDDNIAPSTSHGPSTHEMPQNQILIMNPIVLERFMRKGPEEVKPLYAYKTRDQSQTRHQTDFSCAGARSDDRHEYTSTSAGAIKGDLDLRSDPLGDVSRQYAFPNPDLLSNMGKHFGN